MCKFALNMPKEIKISELIPDDKNFNKGSEFGNGLISKSFSKFGAGRSILIDKNNRIIAGNKSTENYAANGGENVIVVESDGHALIAVKRTDIDLDTPEGREMALADNATAKANIVFDAELIEAEVGEAICVEWGIDLKEKEPNFDDLIGEEKNKPATLKITFESPEQLQKAEIDVQELLDRKYKGAYFSVSAGEI
jgi:hypothetical protein